MHYIVIGYIMQNCFIACDSLEFNEINFAVFK